MKHLKKNKKLSRPKNQRRALLAVLAKGLIEREKILTTQAKAKALKPWVEKLITRSKKNDLAARRYLYRHLGSSALKKICEILAPRYQSRPGGYTRILKHPVRLSDGAKMAMIELVK